MKHKKAGATKVRGDNTVTFDENGEVSYPKFLSPSALPRHIEQEKAKTRHPSNSTSSLYIKDTLVSPDVDALVHCMAVAIEYHIEDGISAEKKNEPEIFDETKHPLTSVPIDTQKPPTTKQIYTFLSTIFKAERLGAQCGILCLAYIERIISIAQISLSAANWRRVSLAALILASKVWEDQAVWNVDFLSIFDCVTVQDLLQLEKIILNLLQFNVTLKAALYARYYFELRSLAEEADLPFPLEPLSKPDAERLETRSEEKEHKARTSEKYKLHRSNSDTNLSLGKSPRAVLN